MTHYQLAPLCALLLSCLVATAQPDMTPPVLNCPANIVKNLGPGECSAVVTWNVTATDDSGMVNVMQTQGTQSGSVFEGGTNTTITYLATDLAGNTSTCSFQVIVNDYSGPVLTALICNNLVHLSLNAACEGFVSTDMILEGGPYRCYDDYLVTVQNFGTGAGGVLLNENAVGLTLGVTITDPVTNNKCWGLVKVEDKLKPLIVCEDVTVDCAESILPGDVPLPEASDNCGEVELTHQDILTGDMCSNHQIRRKWTATDPSGNTAQCIQLITIQPLSLDSVLCPDTYNGFCGQTTDPNVTGWPTINGNPIVPGGLCNIFAGYWDQPLPECGGGSKILRRWTLLDWCAQEVLECVQVIKLADTEPPVLTCPANVTVSTDPWFCNKDVQLKIPTAYDACGTPFTLTPSISAGILIHFGGNNYRADNLPVGTTIVTWKATDACGNMSTCTYTITVKDLIPPVAICDEHTVVSLSYDGQLDQGLTKVPAKVFDDGSYDNCGPVTFLARRMDSCIDFDWIGPNGEYPNNDGGLPEPIDQGLTLQTWVPFACCDVGTTIRVELVVTDQSGNTNSCMVDVRVQDKLSPLITCPPEIIVGCDFWFDAHETNGFQPTDGLENIFGRVLDAHEYNQSDRKDIIITDPSPGGPYYLQPHKWGIDGWADDNCDVTITVDTKIDDDCSGQTLPGNAPNNAVRLIRRTFRATDGAGNRQTCTQRIWVVDYDPFQITDVVCGQWPGGDDVRWPCDLVLTDCPQGPLTPDNLSAYAPNNKPLVHDDNCSLIGIAYDDKVFYFTDNACYKIVRTWTIIDWCQFNAAHLTGYWTYVQVIKVQDRTGPEFVNCPSGPVTYCVADANVDLPANNQVFLGENNPNSSACSAHVRESLTVRETCSTQVTYDVKIYLHNQTGYMQLVAKTTVPVSEGEATLTYDTRQNSLPASHAIRQYGLPYNDKHCSNWPSAGGSKAYHRVLWTVEDGCGNINTCEYLLRLEDCKKPTPVCVSLSSVVMPNSGSVTIWAKDFDASSFDDCTAHQDLLFSFSGTTYQPSRVFDCDAIAANGSPSFLVQIWAGDEGNDQNCNGFVQPIGIEWSERNKDYCTTFIVINDNNHACDPGAGVIGGIIETEQFNSVAKVDVRLMDPVSNISMSSFTTSHTGEYHFGNPLLGYKISPSRNDNHKNGVSTLDLVRIQKHLLGMELLDSPYKLIAADANNSQSVTALDLVEIRKLVLGLYTEFPKNTSWRFVDAHFEFADPSHPWPFAEFIEVNAMTMDHDFIGIKVGDVNGNVVANAQQIENRSGRKLLVLEVEDRDVRRGDIIDIPVSAQNFNNIFGFQLTLETQGIKYASVTSGAIRIQDEHVADHKNAITMSWLDLKVFDLAASFGPASVDPEQTLFTLHFTATTNGRLSDLLKLTSSITDAEAYADLEASVRPSSVEHIFDIALTFGNAIDPSGPEFALFQNEPNPFTDQTTIGFTLPEAMHVELKVYDISGRVVHTVNQSCSQGYNKVVLHRTDLQSSSVYFYQLHAGDFVASKMLLLTGDLE